MQLLAEGVQRVHLLRSEGAGYREVTTQTDWPTYNGDVQRQSLQYTRPDQYRQCLPAGAEMDFPAGQHFAARRHADRCRRNPLYDERQRVLRARRRIGPADLALPAQENAGTHRQRRRRHQQGCRGSGRQAFMATDNAHIVALNRFTGKLVWDTEMADWHLNYNATGAPLIVGSLVISGVAGGDEGARGFVAAFDQTTGKEVMALLDRAKARRSWFGDMERQRYRSSQRGHMAHRDLRSSARHALLAHRQSGAGSEWRSSAAATICTPVPSWLWMRRPAKCAGTSNTRRTTYGTGMPNSRRFWSIRRGTGSRANCCCTPIATASSTCSTGPTASCCWRSRS